MTKQTKCPSCGLDTPKQANCPRCGRMLRKPAQPYFSGTGTLKPSFHSLARLAVALLLISCLLGGIVARFGLPRVGTVTQIGHPGQTNPSAYVIGVDDGALTEYNRALSAQNRHGTQELVDRGRVVFIPLGTPVQIIDAGFFTRKVRILEGTHAGLTGWIEREYVFPFGYQPQ